jgi:hypothetical protein
MTIPELRESSNKALKAIPKDVLLVAIVVLASSASFGLGILAGKGMAPVGETKGFWIEDVSKVEASALPAAAAAAPALKEAQAPKIQVVEPGTVVAPSTGKYLASKNGTKYYLPTCSGAKRIKEENKVWFATIEDAQAAGLGPAANCPGL